MEQSLEEKYIKDAKKGNKDAFSELFRMHYSFLYKYLLKVTLNSDVTEDLIQETMLRCYRNINRYNGQSKFSSWLITIASRLYIDLLRRKRVENTWLENEALVQSRKLKWDLQNRGIEWIDLMDELAKLEPDVRMAILLKHYYGFSYDETAEMLNLKSGTVKSKIHYGISKLRKELKADE